MTNVALRNTNCVCYLLPTQHSLPTRFWGHSESMTFKVKTKCDRLLWWFLRHHMAPWYMGFPSTSSTGMTTIDGWLLFGKIPSIKLDDGWGYLYVVAKPPHGIPRRIGRLPEGSPKTSTILWTASTFVFLGKPDIKWNKNMIKHDFFISGWSTFDLLKTYPYHVFCWGSHPFVCLRHVHFPSSLSEHPHVSCSFSPSIIFKRFSTCCLSRFTHDQCPTLNFNRFSTGGVYISPWYPILPPFWLMKSSGIASCSGLPPSFFSAESVAVRRLPTGRNPGKMAGGTRPGQGNRL